MDLEERSLDDTIAANLFRLRREADHGGDQDAREAGGPFLCSVHVAEALPADEIAEPE